MKHIVVCLFFWGVPPKNFSQVSKSISESLATIVDKVENFELYNKEDYPLGKAEETLFKKDATFAEMQLANLKAVDFEKLSETERISYELLMFILQNRLNRYKYRTNLRGNHNFHVNLNYRRIKPILTYSDSQEYLNLLNDLPRFAEQYFVLLRRSLEEGLSQPQVIFDGFESTYDQHISGRLCTK